MFHAVFLIITGLILLANNFNYIPWTIWQTLIFYWPILIVFAGIDVIFGKSTAGKIFSGVVNSIIFLIIVFKVVGINFPYSDFVPLPKKDLRIERLFINFEKSYVI